MSSVIPHEGAAKETAPAKVAANANAAADDVDDLTLD